MYENFAHIFGQNFVHFSDAGWSKTKQSRCSASFENLQWELLPMLFFRPRHKVTGKTMAYSVFYPISGAQGKLVRGLAWYHIEAL